MLLNIASDASAAAYFTTLLHHRNKMDSPLKTFQGANQVLSGKYMLVFIGTPRLEAKTEEAISFRSILHRTGPLRSIASLLLSRAPSEAHIPRITENDNKPVKFSARK